jgi:hypothetical protein
LERKQQRAEASKALESKNVNLQEVARQGGSLGRKIEREVRRFEATGRVSNWLAGETSKAEAAQAAAQQSGFNPPRSQPLSNTNVPLAPIPLSPSNYFPPRPLDLKPDITPPPSPTTGQGTCIGLNLYTKPVNDFVQVWIGAGTVAGDLPSGFDPMEGKSVAVSGSGDVYAEIEINDSGEITSRTIESSGYTSDPKRYLLGNYVYINGLPQVTNYGCGSVDASVCRNWYASEEPFYNVLLTRCGCAGQQ